MFNISSTPLLQSIRDCARLTGQSLQTMTLFRPIRNIWNRVRDWPRASVTSAGLTWMSRYIYRYPTLMLMNLSPDSPSTQNWPLYSLPPPHFLIGYQYLVRVCNDYVFDTRSYSRIIYKETVRIYQQTMDWSTLANCSYSINAGAYHRFIDLENFEETLSQIQQAILAERVVADLGLLQPMRGLGRTEMADMPPERRQVPVERLLQEQCKNLGELHDRVWGLAERVRIQQAGRKDLVILTTIRRLKAAYFNYLLSHLPGPPVGNPLSLPCDCLWLEAFLERFSDPLQSRGVELCAQQAGSMQRIITHVIDALSLPQPPPPSLRQLSGGAFVLRPRENGRAVTEEMRRRRGEVVRRFIESLPLPTRRRRRAAPMAVSPEPPVPEAEEPGPSSPPLSPTMPPLEGEEEEEALIPEFAPPPPVPTTFQEEVRAAVAEAIRLLEEELTVSARNHEFFNFAIRFYEVVNDLEAQGNINESTIRRWVIYFFVAEHIATTLNYLHHHLRLNRVFARHVELNLAQVVMRARDEEGQVIYSRIWNENGIHAFPQLMTRIAGDLAATVERAGHGVLDEDEMERFMDDINFQENSGDVEEILRQVALNDAAIDSLDLSFRFKLTGPVAFTQNLDIQAINRRVIAHSSRLREQFRLLPELNDIVPLPPEEPPRERIQLRPRRVL